MSKEAGHSHDEAREEQIRETERSEEAYHQAPARPERPDDVGPATDAEQETAREAPRPDAGSTVSEGDRRERTMSLIDDAKEKLQGVKQAIPEEIKAKAHDAAQSTKAAGRDAAELATTTAAVAAQAASTGIDAFSSARDEGQGVGEAVKTAGKGAFGTAKDTRTPQDIATMGDPHSETKP